MGEVIRNVEIWARCVSGVVEKTWYETALREASFEGVSIEVIGWLLVETENHLGITMGRSGDA